MLTEAIIQVLLEKAIDRGALALRKALTREKKSSKESKPPSDAQLAQTVALSRTALVEHVEYVRRWSQSIKIAELRHEKRLFDVHVELDTYLIPLRLHERDIERSKVRPLIKEISQSRKHCVILGSAGAGKTTSLKKLCADFFVKDKVLGRYNFPLLIPLRELSFGDLGSPLYSRLQQILLIDIQYPTKTIEVAKEVRARLLQATLNSYLEELQAVILFDGFDEVPIGSQRDAVLQDLTRLLTALDKTRVIVTSRSPDFKFDLPAIERYEIAPLSPEQIQTFATKWLATQESAADFYNKVMSSPFADAAIRPLTVALLCAIYERIEDIPDKPKGVYRRVVSLLLEDWDAQNMRKRVSRYTNFGVDEKLDFLAHLAFELTTHHKALRFDTLLLKQIYARICAHHSLPPSEATTVIGEVESHSSLIIESGSGHYEFAHKSIQEYLTAYYIVRMPSVTALDTQLPSLAYELAIAASLSSRAIDFLGLIFLREASRVQLTPEWFDKFVTRLHAEKPELAGGDERLTVFVLLELLTSHPPSMEKFPSLISDALPANPARYLDGYYTLSREIDGDALYVKSSDHRTYILPRVLRVPKWLRSDLE